MIYCDAIQGMQLGLDLSYNSKVYTYGLIRVHRHARTRIRSPQYYHNVSVSHDKSLIVESK